MPTWEYFSSLTGIQVIQASCCLRCDECFRASIHQLTFFIFSDQEEEHKHVTFHSQTSNETTGSIKTLFVGLAYSNIMWCKFLEETQ